MRVFALLLCLAATAPETDELADAREMFQHGSAKFAATDYVGAIELWTQLLAKTPNNPEFDGIRLDLLYNIAVAHRQQYDLDAEPIHLRKALTLFQRYEAANRDGSATKLIEEVEAKLAELEAEPESEPPPPSAAPAPVDDPAPAHPVDKTLRNTGIGLLAAGGAALGGGIGLLVAGARLKPAAEEQVAELDGLDLPDDHPAWAEGDAFIEEETRRGTIFMAIGGSLAGLGAVAIAVGAWAMVRSKKGRAGQAASLRVAPTWGGAVLRGNF